jgi:hypothetical protein
LGLQVVNREQREKGTGEKCTACSPPSVDNLPLIKQYEKLTIPCGEIGSGVERNHILGLFFGEDTRQMFRAGCANRFEINGQVLMKHMAIEEKDGAQCLVLGRGRYLLVGGKIRNVFLDFWRAHLHGMSFLMKQDEALDPCQICFFGTVGIVFQAYLVEEFDGGHGSLLLQR